MALHALPPYHSGRMTTPDSRSGSSPRMPALPFILVALAGAVLVAAALYQVSAWLLLRADLLSFAESPFVTDIIKLRLGQPIYTPVGDNNAYPYTPGAPILTYLLARIVSDGTAIPVLRLVQFGYVVLASGVAAATVPILVRLAGVAAPHRVVLVAAAWPLLFLVCLDPTFNPYVHSLHNDGLALLVSLTCFLVAALHAREPRPWHPAAMAVLPAVGFVVKQNQVMWLGLFAIYLFVDGRTRLRRIVALAAVTAGVVALTVAALYGLWGEPFRYWIFEALGDKEVSLARSARHLLMAGGYAALGLAAGLALVRRETPRALIALWVVWAVMFGLQAFTSGLGFVTNHLGPSVVIATALFLVTALRWWPVTEPDEPAPRRWARHGAAAAALVLVFGGLGVVREPRRLVPADAERYIAAIEAEFAEMDPANVLLDNGSWIYLRLGIVMRDRSAPVSLHAGINQPRVNHAALADMLERIRTRRYARILARELDTPRTAYDFQRRGTGIPEAIFEHYHVVRRIPGVTVEPWWPSRMLGEILVLEPAPAAPAP